MTDSSSSDVAASSPYTGRSHAGLEVGELAHEVSDFARRMAPTEPRQSELDEWRTAQTSRASTESLETQLRATTTTLGAQSADRTAPRIDLCDAVYLDGPLAGQKGYALNSLAQRIGFALPPRPGGPTGEYEVVALAHDDRPAQLRLVTATDSVAAAPDDPGKPR